MIGSRRAEFPYNHKTVSVGNASFMWLPTHTLVIFLPKDLIEIKNLFVRLEIDFKAIKDATGFIVENQTPSPFRKIGWIGGSGGRRQFNAAAVNDVASVSHDFSAELDKFGLVSGRPQEVNGVKSIRIDFGSGNSVFNQNLIGGVRLWKVDLVYTTREIR